MNPGAPGRILVTGASGFLGRHLVAALNRAGFPLTLAVRGEACSLAAYRSDSAVRFVPYDLSRQDQDLAAAMEDVVAVVHLAGLAHVGPEVGADAFDRANARATGLLADAAILSDARLFIHMSSIAAITGNAAHDTIDDNTPPHPVTPYGESKLAAETHVEKLAQRSICAISLRPPLVIGHGAKGNWARLQKLADTGLPLPFASARNRRSVASADLLTNAVLTLCRKLPAPDRSGNYCIADPAPLSFGAMLTELRSGMQRPARLVPCPYTVLAWAGELSGRRQWLSSLIDDLVIDPSRFFSTFSFQPSIDLRAAIRRSGQDYLDAKNA